VKSLSGTYRNCCPGLCETRNAIAEVIEQALRKSGIPAEASEVLSHLKIDLPTAQLSAASETLVIVLQ